MDKKMDEYFERLFNSFDPDSDSVNNYYEEESENRIPDFLETNKEEIELSPDLEIKDPRIRPYTFVWQLPEPNISSATTPNIQTSSNQPLPKTQQTKGETKKLKRPNTFTWCLPSDPLRRKLYSDEQVMLLEELFAENPHPSKKRREEIALEIGDGRSEQEVRTWCQNRRASMKRKG